MICFIMKHVINLCLTCKNGAQFLNATFLLLFAFTVKSHVTKTNASV